VARAEGRVSAARSSPMQLTNLAYAQYRLNRFPEAIASARAALRLDSGSPEGYGCFAVQFSIDGGGKIGGLRPAGNAQKHDRHECG
jgi:hypothetical protein